MNIGNMLADAIKTKNWHKVAEAYSYLTGSAIDVSDETDITDALDILNQIRELVSTAAHEDEIPVEPEPVARKTNGKRGRKPKKTTRSTKNPKVERVDDEEDYDEEIQTEFKLDPRRDLASATQAYNKLAAGKVTREELLKAKREGRMITPFSTGKTKKVRLNKEKIDRGEKLETTATCPKGHVYNPNALFGFAEGECPSCRNPERKAGSTIVRK